MMESPRSLVSVIIPTYNEEDDIGQTLDSLSALTYHPLEVIVVDASTDRTPQIVLGYQDRIPGLHLVPQGKTPGVSAARNVGLREAAGQIVIILNGDVFLPPDFIERVMPYYDQGADYVLVDSRVANTEHLFPRYIQAQHQYNLTLTYDELQWTEGFSCRREVALAVGGFPEAFAHNTAGEDGIFGERLNASYHRAVDFSIVVPHIAPHQIRSYWRQRLGRGRGGAYRLYAYDGKPMRWPAIARSALGTLLLAGLLFPPLIYAYRLTSYSERGIRDWLPFTWARIIEMVATAAGYWTASLEIYRQAKATQS